MVVLLLKQMCGMSLVSASGPQWGEAGWVLNAPSWKSHPLGVYSVVQVAIQGAGDRKPKPMEKTSPHRTANVSRGWVLLYIMTLEIMYATIVIIWKWPPT